MFKIIKAIFVWIFSNMNYKTSKAYLGVAEQLALMTKNKTDDKWCARISEIIYDLTGNLSKEDVRTIGDKITSATTSDLMPYKLSLDLRKGVSVESDFVSVTYNPKNKSAKVIFNL